VENVENFQVAYCKVSKKTLLNYNLLWMLYQPQYFDVSIQSIII